MNPGAKEFIPCQQPVSGFFHSYSNQNTQLRATAPEFVPHISQLSEPLKREYSANIQCNIENNSHASVICNNQEKNKATLSLATEEKAMSSIQDSLGDPSDKNSEKDAIIKSGEPDKKSLKSAPYRPPTVRFEISRTTPTEAAQPSLGGELAAGPMMISREAPNEKSAEDEASSNNPAVGINNLIEAHEKDESMVEWAMFFPSSVLPSLFSVSNTNQPFPDQPIKFRTAWALYIDDIHTQPTQTTSQSNSGANSGGQSSSAAQRNSGTISALASTPLFIREVESVAEFWSLIRVCPPPSTCQAPFTYSWFRKDIQPSWEDPKNKNGGAISVFLYDRDKQGLNQKRVMDDAFLLALMSSVGECFEESLILNGLVVKINQSKPVVLQFWSSTSDEKRLRPFANSVRTWLSKILDTKSLTKLEFFSHSSMQSPKEIAGRSRGKGQANLANKQSRSANIPDFIF